MKRLITGFLSASICAATLMAAQPGIVRIAEDDKSITGMIFKEDEWHTKSDLGVVKFALNKPSDFERLDLTVEGRLISSACRVGDTYYYYEYTNDPMQGVLAGGFYALDLNDGTTRTIVSYDDQANGTMFSCLAYDYSTETMYALNNILGGFDLLTIDLETGDLRNLGTIQRPADDMSFELKNLGIDYDGNMYGISYMGYLYRIDPVSLKATRIATIDYNPEEAFMYPHSQLVFDNETDQAYWTFAYYTWANRGKYVYEFRKINLNNGTTEFVDNLTQLYEGIYIPFSIAAPSAPARATDFTVTPAVGGGLSATLNWKNPSKTYGRGGILDSIDKLELYRNGELIETFTDATPGAMMVYTDNLNESGYMTYRLIAYNASGRGDRVSASAFVGSDVPAPVENLSIKEEGNGARIEWTQPAIGKNQGYVDPNSVIYDITRYPDEVKVAQGIPGTSFVDNSITSFSKYYYTVVGHVEAGESDPVSTSMLACGPAAALPVDYPLDEESALDSWTIVDGNEDGQSWEFVRGKVRNCYSYSSGLTALDHLVTPKLTFEKGKRYKVTMELAGDDKAIPELLDVTFGTTSGFETHEILTPFEFSHTDFRKYRVNLPVLDETGSRYIGFLSHSAYKNYCTYIRNVKVEEDHEGTAHVTVKDSKGNLLEGVDLTSAEGTTRKGENNDYYVDYLPAGTAKITASLHGYQDTTVDVNITEYKTSECEIVLPSIPTYAVSGKVKDAVGDAVEDARVFLAGYDEYIGYTDAEGKFTFPAVYGVDTYTLAVSKNNHHTYNASIELKGTLTLEDIVLEDNIKAPREFNVDEDGTIAELTWKKPENDLTTLRYDDGTTSRALGSDNCTNTTMFGNVFRVPSSVKSISWYMPHFASSSFYGVYLSVFLLDENGEPTPNMVYQSYASVSEDQWNTHYLQYPVEAPNGFMAAITYNGTCGLAIDGDGNKDNYPFEPHVSCYTMDYTSGNFHYIEDQGFEANFLMRADVIPYDEVTRPSHFIKTKDVLKEKSKESSPLFVETFEPRTVEMLVSPMKSQAQRLSYDVFRFSTDNSDNTEAWTTVASGLKDTQYTDVDWNTLPKGIYQYAICANYTDDSKSEYVKSNIVGRMHSDLKFEVYTDTPENEAEGATITMMSLDGQHGYNTTVGANGEAEIKHVWQTEYNVYICKEGFKMLEQYLSVYDDEGQRMVYNITENHEDITNLQVLDEGVANERLISWNFPYLLKDDFEGHEAFTINSPGSIGWKYVDGDDSYPGTLGDFTWPGQNDKQAWIVMNPNGTEPSAMMYGVLPQANSGDNYIAAFGVAKDNYQVANDDWIISPRLFFTRDFVVSFQSRILRMGENTETIRVGYSTTTDSLEDFTMLEDLEIGNSYYWDEYRFKIPADAKYVAIGYVKEGGYIAMIDDIRIGLEEYVDNDIWGGYYYAPNRKPVAGSSYEISLNDSPIATTDETTFNLPVNMNGVYKLGVRRKYTSGYGPMATTYFEVTNAIGGISTVQDQFSYSISDGILTVTGGCDGAYITNLVGLTSSLNFKGDRCDLSGFAKGVYLLTVIRDGKTLTNKIIL